jgi:sarcosine oxidase
MADERANRKGHCRLRADVCAWVRHAPIFAFFPLPSGPMPTLPVAPVSSDDDANALDRRGFFKAAGVGAGLLALGACGSKDTQGVPGFQPRQRVSSAGSSSANIVVIGAGIWGSFTAYHLRKRGANVTLVDQYGPGNSRSTSGDETRGVRSSYGSEPMPQRELWMRWARQAMIRWKEFDAEWSHDLKTNLYHTTGDLLMRADWDSLTTNTKQMWDTFGVHYEQLTPDEARHRWPVIAMDDIKIVLWEPDAGVVRARRAVQTVAAAFEHLGGTTVIGQARISKQASDGRVEEVALDTGQTLRADTFIFAVGPWLAKVFPEMATRMQTPLGKACYFGTPVGDERFRYPNLPSYNFPGSTGWPALPVDSSGFRVRGGARGPAAGTTGTQSPGAPAGPDPTLTDPDRSTRSLSEADVQGARNFLALRFPLLKDAPLLETRSCHFDATSSGNFIIDEHPHMSNVWIVAGGNAEGFKQGPVLGEYVAQRVLGDAGDPDVAQAFRIPSYGYGESPVGRGHE